MIIRQIKRRSMVKLFFLLGLNALFFMSGITLGAAEDYPIKPISLTIGYTPGGAAGTSAMIFSEIAMKYLPKPQPILIIYKPGAGTAVAADYVLKQPADGYNLHWFAMDLCTKLAKDGAQLPFKLEDFAFIGGVALTPHTLVVNKEMSPFMKFEDFVDYAKKNPGQVTYSTAGIGTAVHLTGEIIMSRCGVKLNHIPFPGAAPALTALLGGHVNSMVTTVATATAHIKSGGQLRPLAVLTRQRWHAWPDIPTCLEKGYDMDRTVWYGLAARKGTPQPVLDILLETYRKTVEDPKLKEDILNLGYMPVNWGPEGTAKRAREEFDVSVEIFKKIGLLQVDPAIKCELERHFAEVLVKGCWGFV